METKICLKCNNEFNPSPIIDGKRRKLHHRRFCYDCSPFGKNNRQNLLIESDLKKDGGNRKCDECGKPYIYTKARPTRYKKCLACRQRKSRLDFKTIAVAYKGGSCSVCGYDRNISALDFHHINADKKEHSFNNPMTWKKTVIELDKCILLCCRCHREIHNPNNQKTLKV